MSALQPQGPAAEAIAELWWLLLGLGSAVFVVTAGLLLWASLRQPPQRAPRALAGADHRFVAFWGVAMPAVVLAVVVVANLRTGNAVFTPRETPAVTVEVIGAQFWWAVRYDEGAIVSANEINIPAGEPVRLVLRSADVIHSFWVPQLHGKMDLIPGHVNEFWIQADEPGVYRGACAEYCGIQHAKMHLLVVAHERSDFDAWLDARREPPAAARLASDGRVVFEGLGCAACHAVGDIGTGNVVAPDLTHLASRRTLAAGWLELTRENLREWIRDPHAMKRGVRMPPADVDAARMEALLDFLLEQQ